jgi:tRNA (uracil-5-)-methyltransferase
LFQYQPISYESQLLLKQKVVENAFKNFSLLPASAIPTVLPTLPSPKQYGYRTKLTPHFQVPPTSGKSGGAGRNQKGKGKAKAAVAEGEGQAVEEKEWEITIGFEQKGRKRIIDIEECVIATQVINDAMTIERQKVKE